MKPSEVIQEAITNPNLYIGANINNSNTHTISQEYMCSVVSKLMDIDHQLSHKIMELIDKRIDSHATLYSYLIQKGAITCITPDEEVRAEQFKFWADFINELKKKGM